ISRTLWIAFVVGLAAAAFASWDRTARRIALASLILVGGVAGLGFVFPATPMGYVVNLISNRMVAYTATQLDIDLGLAPSSCETQPSTTGVPDTSQPSTPRIQTRR